MRKESSLPFVPLRWHGSLFLLAVDLLTDILLCLSPVALFAQVRRKVAPMWVVDLWVGTLCGLSLYVLFRFNYMSAWGKSASPWLAVYVLLESLGVVLRDVAGSPATHADKEGQYVTVRDPRRWLLMTPIGLVIIIVAFAILYLANASEFNKALDGPLEAVYYSAVTFTTLGYGDIYPKGNLGRCFVIAELGFFVLFLAVKLPIAVALIRTKII